MISASGLKEKILILNDFDVPIVRLPRYRVWLSVVTPMSDPNLVTELIGLAPSLVFVKGKRVPPQPGGLQSGRLSRLNKWTMLVNVEEDRSLEDHLAALQRLLARAAVLSLRKLSENAKVAVEIEVTNEAGINIPRSFVEKLAECGGSIEIDIR